ncbi:MAG: ATPase [Chloroflexi bacterium RBG_16_54_18]|nr:MAG: ATPase [Chloroflexi bacterium RBG_16_54_18]
MEKLNLTAEPGKHEIVITRLFDTSPERLFKVMTDPTLIPRWWGPRRLTTTVDRMDLRKGGLWRFINRDVEGTEFAFNGVYHHIAPPEQLVYTFEFEGLPGHILLETVTLTAMDGKTLLTDSSIFQSVQDRDGMLMSGMESGAAETMERLAELLQKS